MKLISVLILMAVCAFNCTMAVKLPNNRPAGMKTTTSRNTLAQDLDEIARLVPTKIIQRLVIRYLLNDAQFQTFVRIINSQDAYLTNVRFRSQPEVITFKAWLRRQIIYGGELESLESNESLRILNFVPFWYNKVFGWQGFVNEFNLYYPEETIRQTIQRKAAQNPVFAQFVERVKGLKPAYDRVIALPEAKRLIITLEANGINTAVIDNFIRNQFGWQRAVNGTTINRTQ